MPRHVDHRRHDAVVQPIPVDAILAQVDVILDHLHHGLPERGELGLISFWHLCARTASRSSGVSLGLGFPNSLNPTAVECEAGCRGKHQVREPLGPDPVRPQAPLAARAGRSPRRRRRPRRAGRPSPPPPWAGRAPGSRAARGPTPPIPHEHIGRAGIGASIIVTISGHHHGVSVDGYCEPKPRQAVTTVSTAS